MMWLYVVEDECIFTKGSTRPNVHHLDIRVMNVLSDSLCLSPGWGEPYSQQKDSSSWGEPAAAPPVTVDNGTSAWGKPIDSSSSWDEPSRDSRESGPGWGNQHKPGGCTPEYTRLSTLDFPKGGR